VDLIHTLQKGRYKKCFVVLTFSGFADAGAGAGAAFGNSFTIAGPLYKRAFLLF